MRAATIYWRPFECGNNVTHFLTKSSPNERTGTCLILLSLFHFGDSLLCTPLKKGHLWILYLIFNANCLFSKLHCLKIWKPKICIFYVKKFWHQFQSLLPSEGTYIHYTHYMKFYYEFRCCKIATYQISFLKGNERSISSHENWIRFYGMLLLFSLKNLFPTENTSLSRNAANFSGKLN